MQWCHDTNTIISMAIQWCCQWCQCQQWCDDDTSNDTVVRMMTMKLSTMMQWYLYWQWQWPWCRCQKQCMTLTLQVLCWQKYCDADAQNDEMMLILAMTLWCHGTNISNNSNYTVMLIWQKHNVMLEMIQHWQWLHYIDASNEANK